MEQRKYLMDEGLRVEQKMILDNLSVMSGLIILTGFLVFADP